MFKVLPFIEAVLARVPFGHSELIMLGAVRDLGDSRSLRWNITSTYAITARCSPLVIKSIGCFMVCRMCNLLIKSIQVVGLQASSSSPSLLSPFVQDFLSELLNSDLCFQNSADASFPSLLKTYHFASRGLLG
jgi:hypothetical protein